MSVQPVMPDLSGLSGLLSGGGGGGGGALKGLLKGATGALGMNPAGIAAMAALTVGKGIAGAVKRKKAEKIMPQAEDPEERALASYAARRKRAFQTGTAMASQRAALQDAMKVGIDKSFKVGGGAKGLNMMSRMFNQAMLGTQEQALQGETQFAQMEKDAKTRISQRKLELGLLKRAQAMGDSTQAQKEGKSGLMQGLARTIGIGGANPYGTGGGGTGTLGKGSGASSLATVTSEE